MDIIPSVKTGQQLYIDNSFHYYVSPCCYHLWACRPACAKTLTNVVRLLHLQAANQAANLAANLAAKPGLGRG